MCFAEGGNEDRLPLWRMMAPSRGSCPILSRRRSPQCAVWLRFSLLLFVFFCCSSFSFPLSLPLPWRGRTFENGLNKSLRMYREEIMCSPPETSSRMEMLLMHVKSSEGFTQRTFGAFHPWHEGGREHYWVLQHDRGFSFQLEAWKERVIFLHPLREKPHNWLK